MRFLAQFVQSLSALGRKRLAIFFLLMVALIAMTSVSMMMLGKPVRETLYSGLDAEDVNRMGAVLSEVGISFDVNEAGNAVLVEPSKSAQARMILAEKGLPKSDKSGYELFDQVGSLGLTTFMQQVTRVRALEGELVRTIQQLEGIKSARVHLALKSEGTFRSKDEQPSASVVVRSLGTPSNSTASAIRQIVAASIPGLRIEHVTVMTTDGQILSTANGHDNAEPNVMLDLESKIAKEAQERIEKTLGPIAGMNNLRVSVSATLDLDKRQITETDFDPESKVERSTRTVKSTDQSSDGGQNKAVTADNNIPQEVNSQPSSDSNSKKKESKEEQVNYEVDSRQTATVSNGYRIQRLSIAVILNRKILVPTDGTAPDEAKINERISEFEQLVKSAAGYEESRKDSVRVSAMDFITEVDAPADAEGPSFLDGIKNYVGLIINALTIIGALLIIIMLGLRPGLKMLLENPKQEVTALPAAQIATSTDETTNDAAEATLPKQLEKPKNAPVSIPVDKLNKIVGIDVDRAAQVLKQWLDKPAKEAA